MVIDIGFLKLIIVVGIIIILLLKKVHLFYSMGGAAVLLGVLFYMNIFSIFKTIVLVPVSPDVIRVVGVIILVLTLNGLMKSRGKLDAMVGLLKSMFRDLRTVLVLPPAIVGLLPMPAGTLFTASMTDSTGDEIGISRECKTYMNFWFRHIWEFSLPIYPAVILEASIVGIPIALLTRYQFIGSLLSISGGMLFGFMFMPRLRLSGRISFKGLLELFVVLWPIIAVVVGVLGFGMNILVVVAFVIIAFVLMEKVGIGRFWNSFKEINWWIVLDLLGVFAFKAVLVSSGAFKVVPAFVHSTGISPVFVLFFIPVFIGFLTGSTPATVGVTFPTLMGMFIQGGVPDIGLVIWAFTAAYVGVMLSPFHLCLSLSREYFGASWVGVYKLLMLPVLWVSLWGMVIFVWMM